AGTRANVEHGTIAVFDAALPGNFGGGEMAAADNFSVFGAGFFQSANVLLRNYQDVRGGFRIEVFECISEIIFVNFLGRDFSGNNATEYAIGHVILSRAIET